MPSCMRCRENSLTCRAPPGAKRCGECTRVGNMQCGLDGPDPRALQRERAQIEAVEDEAIALDEEAAALHAAAAAEFAAAATAAAAKSAAAVEKSQTAAAHRRRAQRQRAAFQAKVTKILTHEDSAIDWASMKADFASFLESSAALPAPSVAS
ncbi:hypothetical protein B0T26DRAFT_798355 [Lasiosphaeria miniovina]|uniref:Zn(2)-C6 fungal-type domain-containing protein n=1 Tax=Lasiosphaeria miniovina TaxID=1954250 RepID=A0AA40EGH1_9PEZI|nr:uncharacterized protein B0T26DRAFT_798355 [Lasiosphaeria miniovina]KAK0734523.1 hypothetical protein B0T26DRAFT_798355 [Lasiosphaeria miniovina]